MGGVLHPIGPEPVRTYWVRRGLVLLTLAALLAGLVVVLSNLGTAATQAAVPPPAAPAVSTASTASTAAGSPSATPSPTSPSATAARTSSSPQASTSPSPQPSVTVAAAPPPLCAPADLRPTLQGDRRLRTGQATTFTLSLINGTGGPCRLTVDADRFELKIYSGNDRIWSTADCPRAIRATTTTLGAEKALTWRMTWDGKRSRPTCKTRPEATRSGIYWATAQLRGAEPVQVRMTLR